MLLSSLHLASARSACEGCVRMMSFFLPKLAVILASPFALVCICPWQRKVHLQPHNGHSVRSYENCETGEGALQRQNDFFSIQEEEKTNHMV